MLRRKTLRIGWMRLFGVTEFWAYRSNCAYEYRLAKDRAKKGGTAFQ
jgi:hypothetical protein